MFSDSVWAFLKVAGQYVPGAERAWRALKRNVPQRHTPVLIRPETWEDNYRSSYWTYLRSLDEMGRYSILVGLIQRLAPHAKILDVGCGEGLLQEYLQYCPYLKYVGIDLSEEAIQQARVSRKLDERTVFLQADAVGHPLPEKTFDVIVVNECLYYFKDPFAIMEKCVQALRPGGFILVSMCLDMSTKGTHDQFVQRYKTKPMTTVINDKHLTWYIYLLRS
jgi:2-polyprenyl-3-methyl-5-hydroxy-6-metoxy-1,4-benzoquinol methylase